MWCIRYNRLIVVGKLFSLIIPACIVEDVDGGEEINGRDDT